MGFSRQEHWSGLPYPLPGDLPDPGIEPVSLMSPAWAGRFPGKPQSVSQAPPTRECQSKGGSPHTEVIKTRAGRWGRVRGWGGPSFSCVYSPMALHRSRIPRVVFSFWPLSALGGGGRGEHCKGRGSKTRRTHSPWSRSTAQRARGRSTG